MKEFVLDDGTAVMVPDAPKKRGNILIEAYETINGDRQDQYGHPEDNFQTIADLWTVWCRGKLHEDLTAHDVAVMMSLMKFARIKTGTGTHDSYVDAAGYLGLANSIGEKQ